MTDPKLSEEKAREIELADRLSAPKYSHEEDFLAFVMSREAMGFGRMIQMIQGAWYRHLRAMYPQMGPEGAAFGGRLLDYKDDVIARLEDALKYYAGNFDGRKGTRWNGDTFFIETKFGTTESADGPTVARKALGGTP